MGAHPGAAQIASFVANVERPIFFGIGGGYGYTGDDNEAPPVTVFNTSTNAVVASYNQFAGVGAGFAYDPVRSYAYLAVGTGSGGCMAVFHAAALVQCVAVPQATQFSGPVFDPETDTVWVAGGSQIWILAGTQIVGSIPIGAASGEGAAYDPANGQIYFAGGPGLIAIDALTEVETGQISFSENLYRMTIDPVTSTIFATMSIGTFGPQALYSINPATGKTTRLSLTNGSEDVAFDAKTGLVYVSTFNSSTYPIAVVNGTTDTVVGRAYTSDPNIYVWGIATDSSSGDVYLADVATPYIDVFQPGTAYFANFTESGLRNGRVWSVTFNGYTQTAVAPANITFGELNGTYAYSVPNVTGYLAAPSAGHVTLAGRSVTTAIVFSATNYLALFEKYRGDFLQNVSFTDVLGIYTDIGSVNATNITASIGGKPVSYAAPAGWGGPYNITVNMGNLPGGAELQVTAYYNNSTLPQKYVITRDLNLSVAAEPAWLSSMITRAGTVSFNYNNSSGEWENTVQLVTLSSFPLATFFGTALSDFWISGTTDVVPDVNLSFQLGPGNFVTLTGAFELGSANISAGNLDVSVSVDLTVTGVLAFNDTQGTITWVNSTVTLTVSGGVTWTEPILGWSVSLGGYKITIGLNLVLELDASVTANFLIEPTSVVSQEVFAGLIVKMETISTQFEVAFTAALQFEIPDLVSLEGGGKLTYDMTLQLNSPYDAGGSLTGELFISATFIPTGSEWSYSYPVTTTWGAGGAQPAPGPTFTKFMGSGGNTTNFTSLGPIPRYYNTSSYDTLKWVTGNWSGRFIRDIYPFTQLTEASAGTHAYLVYSTDNVSRPESRSATLQGWDFNSVTRATSALKVPVPAGEVVTDPVLSTLPNGSVIGLWTGLPFSLENLSAPINQPKMILQSALYNPATKTWSAVKNWTSWGVARSYQVATNHSQSRLVVLVGGGVLSTTEYVLEFNLTNGALLKNWTVTNETRIAAFSAVDNFVGLANAQGAPAGLNLLTGAAVPLPSESGYTLVGLAPAPGTAHMVSLLFGASRGDLAVLYNLSSQSMVLSISAVPDTASAQFFLSGTEYYLLTANRTQILLENYLNGTPQVYRTVAPGVVYGVQAVLVNSSLLVAYLTNTGNSSDPLLNLSLLLAPLSPPPAPKLTLGSVTQTSVTLRWTETLASPYAVDSYTILAGTNASNLLPADTVPASTTSIVFSLKSPGNHVFAVRANNAVGNGTRSNIAGIWTVNFTEYGLPSGKTFSVTLNGTKLTSVNGTVLFEEINKSYSFTVGAPTGYTATPASGTAVVANNPTYVAVDFVTTGTSVHSVTFTESGLPSGTWWILTFSGAKASTTGTSMVVWAPPGTFNYTIGPVPGYTPSPAKGSVVMKKSNLKVSISFTKAPVAISDPVVPMEAGRTPLPSSSAPRPGSPVLPVLGIATLIAGAGIVAVGARERSSSRSARDR